MLLSVQQTKAGAKKEYHVQGGTRHYFGKAPSLRSQGNIQLNDSVDLKWQLKYQSSLLAAIPVGDSLGRQRSIHHHQLVYQEQPVGEISELLYEKVMSRFDVKYKKLSCQIYPLRYGKQEALLVFVGELQIAHIKRETATVDLKDQYLLYLLDQEQAYEVPLLLFILYYDHWYHGDRGKMRKNYHLQTSGYWFSEAVARYDAHWLSKNFPEDSSAPIVIDPRAYEAKKRQRIVLKRILEIAFVILFPVILISLVVTNPYRVIPLSVVGLFFLGRGLFQRING